MKKEQVIEMINKFNQAKALLDEANDIVNNCNRGCFNCNILNNKDFYEVCKILELPIDKQEFADSIHYTTSYEGLTIVNVVFKGEL